MTRARMLRPCLDCGAVTAGPRCPDCTRPVKRRRNAERDAAATQVARRPWCARCGATDDLTADHLVAFEAGGTLADGARTLCRRCNATIGGRASTIVKRPGAA